MARPLYSQVLWEGYELSPGTYLSDTVPDGYVWVIRDMVFLLATPVYQAYQGFYMTDQSVGAPLFAVGAAEAWPMYPYHWEGRQVLNAEDQINLTTYDGQWSWRISGYLLSAP